MREMKEMRVLHVNNIADVAGTLSRAQREIGMSSEVAAVKWRYSSAVDHPILPDPPGLANMRLFFWILRNLHRYDLLHYHGRVGLTALYYKTRRIPAVLHFHGSELRDSNKVRFTSFARWAFVSTPDLIRHAHKVNVDPVEYLPNPVFLEGICPVNIERRGEEVEGGRPPVVVHLPTDRRVKGTVNLLEAVEILRSEGIDVDLRIVEEVEPEKALRRMREADIVVDWISPRFEIYGMVSIQAMAMGIPVVCHIDPALYPKRPPLEVVEPSAEGVAEGLKRLIRRAKGWGGMGRRERRYVEATHDAIKIAKRVKEVYEEVLTR